MGRIGIGCSKCMGIGRTVLGCVLSSHMVGAPPPSSMMVGHIPSYRKIVAARRRWEKEKLRSGFCNIYVFSYIAGTKIFIHRGPEKIY